MQPYSYTEERPPPLYPRLPSAPPNDHKVAPPRPTYPPGGSPYPPPGMHRSGPVTGAVPVLPPINNNSSHDIVVIPPRPHYCNQPEVVVQSEVIVVTPKSKEAKKKSKESKKETVDGIPSEKPEDSEKASQKLKDDSCLTKKDEKETSKEDGIKEVKKEEPHGKQEVEAGPLVDDKEAVKVARLRKRNYVFMALAGLSFLLCLNVVCGALALVFAILAEMDLGNGKVKDGRQKSVVSIVLTVVGGFVVLTLLTVFLVVNT